jgi:hypothetical protein
MALLNRMEAELGYDNSRAGQLLKMLVSRAAEKVPLARRKS